MVTSDGGCDKKPDMLGRSQQLCVCLTQFGQGLQASLPTTVGVFLVRHFELSAGRSVGSAEDEQRIGRMTGLLGSLQQASGIFTAFLWGRASDVFGRKPVIVAGNCAAAVMVVAFGMSTAYWQACLARSLGGLFSGVIGALKTIIGESCGPQGQAKALGFLSLAWGVGGIAGPFVGGMLSDPCQRFGSSIMPLCGEGELLQTRPFLLPCLVVGLASATAACANTLLLQETLPGRQRGGRGRAMAAGGRYQRLKQDDGQESDGDGDDDNDDNDDDEHGAGRQARSCSSGAAAELELQARCTADGNDAVGTDAGGGRGMNNDIAHPRIGIRDSTSPASEQLQQRPSTPERPSGAAAMRHKRQGAAADGLCSVGEDGSEGKDEGGKDEGARLLHRAEAGCAGGSGAGRDGRRQPQQQWWRMPPVHVTLAGYALIALLHKFNDETFPLLASTSPAQGGLGWGVSQLALPLSAGGLSLMLFALLGYPWAQAWLGPIKCARLGLLLTVPVALIAPCASLVPSSAPVLQQAVMIAAAACRAVVGNMSFTPSMVLVNLAAPRSAIGSVNGVGQTMAACMRALAPALAGMVWSAVLQLPWVGHQFLPYMFLGAGALAVQLLYTSAHLPSTTGS